MRGTVNGGWAGCGETVAWWDYFPPTLSSCWRRILSQSAGQSVLWPPQLPLLSQTPRPLRRSRRLSSESRSRLTRRLLRRLVEAHRLHPLSVARYPRPPREMAVFLDGRSQCAPPLAESSSRVPCRGLCRYLGLRPGVFHHVRRKS